MPKTSLLSENLRRLRNFYGYTQKELAAHFKVTQEAYSKWERGICSPSLRRLDAVATFYGLTADDILSRKSNELLRTLLEQPPPEMHI